MTHTGVQPVRSAGARHSGTQAGTSVSQIAMLIMVSLQICTKWKLQSEALTRTTELALPYCTAPCNSDAVRRRD